MSKLFVTLGVSGAGKSTWVEKHIQRGTVRVNPDLIRKELTGSISDQSQNKKVFETAYQRTRQALEAGLSAMFDSTALASRTRKELLKIAEEYGAEPVLIVFRASEDANLCRGRVQIDLDGGVDRADTTRIDIIDRQCEAFREAMRTIHLESWKDVLYA